jgi:hypothetical protein
MRLIAITVQILIGVTLLFAGLNHLLNLMAHLPAWCIAQQSISAIFFSRYLPFLFGLQLLGSLLLLVGCWKRLTLVLLGPIALSLVLFHFLMEPVSFVSAVLLVLLEFLAIWACRPYFRSAFVSENQLGSP